MAADRLLDTGQDFLQDARHKDMLQLLEKIPFSDPSLLVPTYKTFGKQVYDLLHTFDAKEDDSQKCSSSESSDAGWKPYPCSEELACLTAAGFYDGGFFQPEMHVKELPISIELPLHIRSINQKSDFTLTLMRNLKTPDGMHDSKAVETASVCSSEGICESLVPCNVPEPEAVPEVEERSKDDKLWSDFNEVIDADFPSPPLPLEGYIPIAFDNDFKSILYSTCEDYHTWMAEAVDFLQTAEQLKIKYQAVAEMQSTEFPTPLRDAECVSLLMAYELYRASQSEDNSTFLEWIACQLCSNNSERNPAYLFACLTLLGGVCFFAESECFPGFELGPEEMITLLQQAVAVDELSVAQFVLNWQQDVANYKDPNGWAPLHLAAERNAPTMIHILCNKSAEKEETTYSGNTPLLVAASANAEDSIKALLANKANPNAVNYNQWSPAHYAAVRDNANMIELLHQHGGELNATTLKENSPLSLAVINDSKRAAAMLIQKCTTLGNWTNSSNWTAVHLAASKNAPKMLQILTGPPEVELNAVTNEGNTPLAVAVIQSCLQAAEVLINANANLDIPNSEGWCVLHVAAQQDACDLIRLLCDAGANTEISTHQGNTPLCIAAMNGCSDAAAELVKQKANPNARNECGWSAIHYAAAANASVMVSHIGQGNYVNLNLKTDKENTALLIAVTHGAKDAAKALVDAGADANVKGPEEWTALHFAVNQDDYELIKILNDARADVNAICSGDKTSLMLAVMKNSMKSVQVLLDSHANPSLRDIHGWSALHMAAVSGELESVEILKLLLDNGACMDGFTNKGNTALTLAVLKNYFKNAEALLHGKANPCACGDHLWTPLHIAAEKNYTELMELLCTFGANVNATNQQGYTPLVISVVKGSQEAVGILLKNDANPNVQSELNGWSALHFTAQEENHAVGEMLCRSADLNVRTHEGNTPLLIAAMKQSKRVVSTLLRRKADANACDAHGWTALHCAAQVNASEIIPLLYEYSAKFEAKTEMENTPLAIAVIHNAALAAEELINLGADVNATNCDGWTPLCCAIHNGSFDVELFERLCSPTNVSMQSRQHRLPLDLCDHNSAYADCRLKHGAKHSELSSPIVAFSPGTFEAVPDGAELAVLDHHEGHDGPNVEETPTRNAQGNVATSDLDLDTRDKGNARIHIADHDGDKKCVADILKQNADLAYLPGEKGYLPIQFAAIGNHPDVIELLSHYCNAQDIKDQDGYTLLHLAAYCNCAEAAKFLLCSGHRSDARNNDGYCPIHVAALFGSTAVIGVFLQHDVGMLSLVGSNEFSVLHCAAGKGQAKVVEFICSNYPADIDINYATSLGGTPLHIAAASTHGNAEVIKALCSFGADVTILDDSKDTSLHYAVLRNDEEKAKALLSANPKLVNAAGASGETPLHWAVKTTVNQGSSKEPVTSEESKMIDILCDASNNVSPGDQYGNTPLHFATAYTRDEVIVQQLLAKGADPEKQNREGLTPLDFAASNDARNCFVDMYNKAQETYNIDKVYYDMHRAHEYIRYHQMDKAGKLMCSSVPDAQFWKFLKDDSKYAHKKVSLIFIMNQDVDDISCQPPFKAVLDKCIYGKKVIRRPALFEADREGNLPGSSKYRTEDGSFLSNLVKKPKLLFALADHPALQAYVSYRWGQIASPFFWRGLLFYFLQLFLLTFALASAARPDLPLNGGYRDPIDVFRGICEAAILLITVVRIVVEVFEFLSNKKAYLLDWLNYVQWFFIVLILAVVPLRATAHPGQWIVAALAYLVFGLQAFEFLIISSTIGVYVQTLIIILWRDIFKFLSMFAVVLVVFSGPLYLSLRYDADLANSTTAALLSGEGSLLHETYFSGLRIMIEAGSILDYYGRSGSVFGPLTVMLYLLFLFLVVIILLNVLIAQVSETYTAVQSTARASFLFHRSRFITRCEESTALWFLLWTFRWNKIGSSCGMGYDVESQTNADRNHPKCCKCLRRKVVREVIYCHDDDEMYWPGQLFHKNKNGKYLDLSLRARFGRRMESARKFMEEHIYPKIVSAYEETPEPDAGESEEDNTLETLKKASEAQSAAMKDLQEQIKMIAERLNAYLKCPDAQMEEVTVADGASGDCLRQQKLNRPVQQEVQLSSSGDI